jgi:hypothetical protein
MSVWNNGDLERQCLLNLNDFYTSVDMADSRVKAVRVYLLADSWNSYKKVSSGADDGVPTYRKARCSYVLQKDADKFIIVLGREIIEDCVNYDRATLKPISYGPPRVATLSAYEWEEWEGANAFKLTKEQAGILGLIAGKKAQAVNQEKSVMMMDYSPGMPLKITVLGKSEAGYLFLWDGGDLELYTHEAFSKALNSKPQAADLKVGDHVSAQWTNGSFYPGRITAIKGSLFTIEWDDGDTPVDVTADQIRMLD